MLPGLRILEKVRFQDTGVLSHTTLEFFLGADLEGLAHDEPESRWFSENEHRKYHGARPARDVHDSIREWYARAQKGNVYESGGMPAVSGLSHDRIVTEGRYDRSDVELAVESTQRFENRLGFGSFKRIE